MEDNDKVIIYFTKFANFLRKHANADNKWFYKAAPYSKLAEAITAMGATKLTSSKQIDVKGIGKKTKEKVDEFLSTGKVQEYEDLRIELEGDGTGGGEEGGGGGANKEGGAGAAIPVNKDAAMAMNFL
jgi:DNA polymerase/3'-5' exonuclease PolX